MGKRYEVQVIDRKRGDEYAYVNDTVTGDVAQALTGPDAIAKAEEWAKVQNGETQDDDLIHFWTGLGDASPCGVNIRTTPHAFGSPRWIEVTCHACHQSYADYAAALKLELAKFAKGEDPYPYRLEEIMTTVPNWIAKAVILNPRSGIVQPIVEWRATQTQVIVRTEKRGPERRFRLDGLTEVGQSRGFPSVVTHLAAPDDPDVIDARRARAASRARTAVMMFVDAQRLHDSQQDAATVAGKLTAIRDEAAKALAELEPFL